MNTRQGLASLLIVLTIVVLSLGLGSVVFLVSSHPPSSNTNGTVEGVVSVGPSQPVCHIGESCNVNMTGYRLVFNGTRVACPSAMCPKYFVESVALRSDGRYSLPLPAGTYRVTLTPCPWLGCSRALPTIVTVISGQTMVLNVSIDTGIR